MGIGLLLGRYRSQGPSLPRMNFSLWHSLKGRLFGSGIEGRDGEGFPPSSPSKPQPKRYCIGEAADLQDGQLKEATFSTDCGGRPRKVLLSRVAGKYYATGHLCPHYKAPLVKGVLTEEGRLVCPWHAACFDVTRMGDIEEAPAIEALKSYPVVEEADGKLYIFVGEEEDDMTLGLVGSRPAVRTPITDWPKDDRILLVIGGGAAGAMAAESARHAGFRGRILVVSREPHLPVDRIKLSKFLSLQANSILLHQPSYLEELRIEYMLDQQVVSVSPQAQQVTLADGRHLPYDRLLIATGGEPRRLSFLPGGDDYSNVYVIRHLSNNEAILQAVQEIEERTGEKPRVLIIGASFIGMEAAGMMSKLSASVTVVGMENVPLERVLGAQVGSFMQRLQEQNGTIFRLGVSLKGFLPHPDDPSRARAIEMADGTIIETDLVILGVGIRLATEFLVGSGVPLLDDGSLPVDTQMRVRDHANIFAAGDIATFPYEHQVSEPVPLRVEHWDVALQQGRIAGHNMAVSLAKEQRLEKASGTCDTLTASPLTPPMKNYDSVPFFFTLQFGKSVRYAGGTPAGYDGIHVDSDGPTLAAYYYKNDTIMAVATIGRDPLAIHCSELIREGRMPSLSAIKLGTSPLSIRP